MGSSRVVTVAQNLMPQRTGSDPLALAGECLFVVNPDTFGNRKCSTVTRGNNNDFIVPSKLLFPFHKVWRLDDHALELLEVGTKPSTVKIQNLGAKEVRNISTDGLWDTRGGFSFLPLFFKEVRKKFIPIEEQSL